MTRPRNAARTPRIWPWLTLGALTIVGAGTGAAVVAQQNTWTSAIVHTSYQAGLEVEFNLDYDQKPPAGGPYHPQWQRCGIYHDPLYDTHVVHTLELGAVWITYRADRVDEDGVAQLEQLGRDLGRAVVSPYPAQRAPVVITAWNAQLAVPSADDPRLVKFADLYLDRLTTPKAGTACTGGTDATAAPAATTTTTTVPASGSAVDTAREPISADTANGLVGLAETAAESEATARGWVWRIGARDGAAYPTTKDWNPNRVTVTITAGLVTAVSVG